MKKIIPILCITLIALLPVISFAQKKSAKVKPVKTVKPVKVVPEVKTNIVTIEPGDSQSDIIRKAANLTPSPRQLRWQKLELTAFFHFGMNTFTNQEWGNGKEDPSLFNPSELDASQWVRTVKAAGFKQVIITAKHHDGFCLWPSKYTQHSVKNSPWKKGKGDVVKEVADACHENKIGFGVYLSPWDRNSSLYGDSAAYNTYFMNQLTELLTRYGKVDEVWFDGANGEGPNGKKQVYNFEAWYALIRKLQPAATIAIMGPDVRWVGTETGYGRDTEWSVVPLSYQDQHLVAASSQKDVAFVPKGDRMGEDLGSREKIYPANALAWYPAETDVSIRPGWFYHPEEDSKVKLPGKLLDIYYSSVGKNSILLLNIPPDRRGLINENDIKNLQAFHKIVKETFSNNLLGSATIKSSNGTTLKTLTDDDLETYWTAKGNDTTAVFTAKLKEEREFDVLSLQENIEIGQRIEGFMLEYKLGEEWKKIAEGTTVGYKRLIRFLPVTASEIRLTITSSRLNPTLSEVGLYKQKP